ncbi:hypothetical protein OSG_eHP23_00180 [environmental Halophage eHP-23]|nr:hypothetical protein OSG_eHP23_00180 [environmental Halophage eHP-23]
MILHDEENVRYAKSYIGEQWYRVTEYEKIDDKPVDGRQRIVAEENQPVNEEDVPDQIIEAYEEDEERPDS